MQTCSMGRSSSTWSRGNVVVHSQARVLVRWVKKQFLRSLYYVINFYNHADPTLVTNYENLAKI